MSIAKLLELDQTLHAVVATEFLKLRRSKVVWMSFLIYGFMIAMLGLFMWIALNPGMAESLGLLGQKANFAFAGESLDWAGFLGMVFMMASLGGMIFLSFIVVFIFGREYAEGTEKNLLVLPVPRGLFVLAKFVVAALWFALLSAWLLPLSFVVGKTLGLAGFDARLFWGIGGKILVSGLLSFSTCSLVALIAVATKGYFAPLGYATFTLVLASLFGHTGWAPWVPWSIVGLYSGAAGAGPEPTAGSYLVLAATFLLGLGLTLRHETRADNVQ
ncbi:MAG: ABC transporter permease [Spirochaetaceae bacterium]|nr:ABC transporter permease [Spirochaetaceae bacterium]